MKTKAKKLRTVDLVYIAAFAALMAICSWISVPATVEFTMQTFAVFTALGLLGGYRALIAVCVYLLLGVVGLPVFAGFHGGVGALLGEGRLVRVAAMATALIVCYAFGTAWFVAVYARQAEAVGWLTALGWCVFPFIIPDVLKMALALVLTDRLKKRMK